MPSIELNEINWLAVAVAAIAAFMIGGVWYGAIFGDRWSKAQGWTDEQVAAVKAGMSPPKFFGGMILSYFVLAIVLAALGTAAQTHTLVQGICLGGMLWVVTSAVTMTHHLATGKVFAAFAIDAGCEFIYMLVMGAIIGAWH